MTGRVSPVATSVRMPRLSVWPGRRAAKKSADPSAERDSALTAASSSVRARPWPGRSSGVGVEREHPGLGRRLRAREREPGAIRRDGGAVGARQSGRQADGGLPGQRDGIDRNTPQGRYAVDGGLDEQGGAGGVPVQASEGGLPSERQRDAGIDRTHRAAGRIDDVEAEACHRMDAEDANPSIGMDGDRAPGTPRELAFENRPRRLAAVGPHEVERLHLGARKDDVAAVRHPPWLLPGAGDPADGPSGGADGEETAAGAFRSEHQAVPVRRPRRLAVVSRGAGDAGGLAAVHALREDVEVAVPVPRERDPLPIRRPRRAGLQARAEGEPGGVPYPRR